MTLGRALALITALAASGAGAMSAQTLTVRATGGYGFNDRFNTGLGAGLTAAFRWRGERRWLLGGRAMYHFGDGLPDTGADPDDRRTELLMSSVVFGAQLMTRPVMVRVLGHFGMALVTESTALRTDRRVEPLAGPSLLLALPLPHRSFFGFELRFVTIPGFDDALAIYATVGTALTGN